ncbi:chromosome segregation protein SMC [Ancylobacter oerskovii]|uniref:Chromosome partition protein Smc n=1 Tax=Ancylobacter oerskovii TaxID=459519 RepID=A0ABW4YWW4_9HYPH|nr:chromosome segregation protein SMC [Ancylobacter oerskovii]MBS7542368.1 chromosome segregation protein SMC [Ancylobacter oerskovii]
MKFTRLRLLGFKTFVEPTEMLIEPGLTGVVGPNGCGKSNLVEALRWVMGENSYKAMRAEGMDDVIFGGTTTRPARNTAEVMLVIENEDRTAPAIFNDADRLEVSRRIEREAGSSYRINGREVRARDVQILFADASSGSRSPSMVRQGQIGEIVGSKPTARRRILEEAAGVAGLHARRHEAEMRLRAAEANLARLEDVIGQIGTQLDALRRQSRQAVRYRAISGDIRKAEATLLWLRWSEAAGALAEASRTLDLAVREVAACTTAQGEAARAAAVAAHGLPGLREADAAAAAALQRLTLARGELDGEEARASARVAELDRRLAQLAGDLQREAALAADADGMLARLEEETAALQEIEAGATEALEVAQEERVIAEEALAGAEAAFTEATAANAEGSARRAGAERVLREETDRLARLDRELAQLAEQARAFAASADADRLEERRAAAEAAAAAFAEAEALVGEVEAAHAAARAALDHARRPLAEAERAAQRLDTEQRTLMKLLDVGTPKRFPPVLDQISVARGFETALGAALGDDLDAPAVDFAAAGEAPVRWSPTGQGELPLQPPRPADSALPPGAEPLAVHVQAPAVLARRLAQIGVVARADGPHLLARLAPGQRLVSREGDLWRWDGFAAAADAPTMAARRLAERNRLADLDAQLAAARDEVATHRAALNAAEQALRAAGSREGHAREARRAALRATEATREDYARAERAGAERAARKAALDANLERATAEREQHAVALEEAHEALAALPPPGAAEALLAEARLAVAQYRAALAEARSAAEGLVRERDQRRRRLDAILHERESWKGRAAGTGERVDAIEARREEAAIERADLDDAPALFAARRRELLSAIERAEAARRDRSDSLVAAEAASRQAEQDARAALEALSAAREASARAETRLEGARQRREDLIREIADTLDGPPESARQIAGIETDSPRDLPDPQAVEADLDRLKRERERLGAVNLRAEEELAEVEGQQQGLAAECDDLTEAIKRLRQGISSLNREARERLNASFAVVDGHFRQLFGTLFGGGEAQLVLTDSEDPLEAGLDIIAKPPGKKPQSLSLLSGGEQALTAMALIFAVFLTNPSPICVLDEVDAPLDDANVERFCNLLDEMRRLTQTRFVTITHNPITMSRMNRLFGVTMAERGVSRLVSVDLATAESYREAS